VASFPGSAYDVVGGRTCGRRVVQPSIRSLPPSRSGRGDSRHKGQRHKCWLDSFPQSHPRPVIGRSSLGVTSHRGMSYARFPSKVTGLGALWTGTRVSAALLELPGPVSEGGPQAPEQLGVYPLQPRDESLKLLERVAAARQGDPRVTDADPNRRQGIFERVLGKRQPCGATRSPVAAASWRSGSTVASVVEVAGCVASPGRT
jgi:hypothetical protein